jgi:hypothetical protein
MGTSAAARQASEFVEEGIAALISGRKAQARLLLEQALQVDRQSEKGWLWLSGAVDTDEERRFCLKQVMSINEWNLAAQKGLKELGPGFARSPIMPLAPTARPEPSTPAAEPEPPASEAPALSQWRPETDVAAATESPLPKAWLIAAAILVAGLLVGLALLFVINAGLLGQ